MTVRLAELHWDQLVGLTRAQGAGAGGPSGVRYDGIELARGTGVGVGRAIGRVVASVDDANQWGTDPLVWVAPMTTPGDVPVLRACVAVVTERGGPASHAAIVARELGLVAVCGVGPHSLRSGDWVVVDAERGAVFAAASQAGDGRRSDRPAPGPGWTGGDVVPDAWRDALLEADAAAAPFRVLANADTAESAAAAIRAGAAGIGLCRTEHALVDEPSVVGRFLAGDPDATDAIVERTRQQAVAVLRAAGSRPVGIRLLDAPPAEFASPTGARHGHSAGRPTDVRDRESATQVAGWRAVQAARRHPDLYPRQASAIAAAAEQVRSEGVAAHPELLIPMVTGPEDVEWVRQAIAGAFDGPVVAMVETPRAVWLAADIAPLVDGLAVGTNDLTQLMFGWSRDDASAVAVAGPAAAVAGPAAAVAGPAASAVAGLDPFVEFDRAGVGSFLVAGLERARTVRPDLPIRWCGQAAATPANTVWAYDRGFHAVSVPADAVLVGRWAAGRHAAGLGIDSGTDAASGHRIAGVGTTARGVD